MKIENLFSKETAEHIKTVKATKHEGPKIQSIQDGEVKGRKGFEKEVFSYLIKHKEKQKIDVVYPFANMCVDGALKLNNGKAIALEIKHSLNWLRVCNARVEIQRLQKDPEKWDFFTSQVSKNLDGGLIVFQDFSADWRDKWLNYDREWVKGWYHFYEEEAAIGNPKVPIRIAQLTQERLGFGIFSKKLSFH